MTDITLMSPYIQFGFAGFAFVMLGVVVWMIRNLLKVMRETNTVIGGNTEIIGAVHSSMDETKLLAVEIKDRQLSRPCMLPEKLKDQIEPIIRDYHAKHGTENK